MLVKLLNHYDDTKKKVEVVCFDIENTVNTSDDAACAIDHSLKLFKYAQQNRLHFLSSTTDAGGEGIKKPLVDDMVRLNRAEEACDYIYSTCVLHTMNLMISVPCETLLGSGGLKKRAFLQVIHTAYTLKGLFPIKSWRDFWLIATSAVWEDLKYPVFSR